MTQTAGRVMSTLGAIILLAIYRRVSNRKTAM